MQEWQLEGPTFRLAAVDPQNYCGFSLRAERFRPYWTRFSLPNKPFASSLGPAVNKMSSGVVPAPPPGVRAQRPSIDRICPVEFRSWPRNVPEVGSKALIRPSPKFPTSMSPANLPKVEGARARPHGAFNGPRDAKRRTRWPLVSNTSTKP